MVEMGYNRKEVEHSLQTKAYDDPFATYLLLGTKPSEVSKCNFSIRLRNWHYAKNLIAVRYTTKVRLGAYEQVSGFKYC